MKLYAFTEQGLKDLLDKQKENIKDRYNKRCFVESFIESIEFADYPDFPEPIELPDEESIRLASRKPVDGNLNIFISGANHIIELIKNGLK